MGHGPHGKHAIKAYIKGHINTFLFDFNERLRQRRKAQSQDAEQNQAVPSTDTTEDVSAVLSPGLAVGCDGTNSHCASEAIQPDEDYPYLG